MAKVAAGGGDIAKLIGVAGAVLEAAVKLGEQAKPLLDEIDADAVAAKAKGKAGGMIGKVGAAVGKAGAGKDALFESIRGSKDERALKKLIKSTKQVVLESAPAKMTITDFLKRWMLRRSCQAQPQ